MPLSDFFFKRPFLIAWGFLMYKKQYKPTSIEEIVFGNAKSSATIESLITGRYPIPDDRSLALLIYGSFGTGKTTLARMLPDAIEWGLTGTKCGMAPDFFDCQFGRSGQTIADTVSTTLDRCAFFNKSERWYFILDEADNLTESAMRSMKGLLNRRNAVFVLTTNYVSRLDEGLVDRCVPIEMNPPSKEMLLASAQRIAREEDVVLNDKQLLDAAMSCNGSFRRLGSIVRAYSAIDG